MNKHLLADNFPGEWKVSYAFQNEPEFSCEEPSFRTYSVAQDRRTIAMDDFKDPEFMAPEPILTDDTPILSRPFIACPGCGKKIPVWDAEQRQEATGTFGEIYKAIKEEAPNRGAVA